MHIVIVGAGVIGSNLAKTLSDEDHKVYLIEQDPAMAQRVDEKLDVKVVLGSGSDPEVLSRAMIEQADLVVAVTNSDEINLVICSLAKAFGAKQSVARVRNTSLSRAVHDFGYERFCVDEIINPEDVAAQTVVKSLETPGAREVVDFADGKILLRTFNIPQASPLCGMKIQDLKCEDFPWPFLIIAIMRERTVLIPKGADMIQAGDRIFVFLPPTSASEFLSFVNPDIKKPKKVVIYGATAIGICVAGNLAAQKRDVVLLEENAALAERVAGILEGVRVINGAASEADILKECGMEAADAFVATSDHDHSNLISAVLAKKMGAKQTIITTQQPDYMTIIDALDIDVIINPRFLAVDQILRFVRGKGISSITKFMEVDAEALELITEEGAVVTKAPLKEINFPKNSIVGAVCSKEEIVLATGDTQIKTGDSAIVFCEKSAVKKLHELFTRKKIF